MTEENISNFSLFLCKNCNPPWTVQPHFPQQSPSKNFDHVKHPPFFENLAGDSTSHQKRRGSHYVFLTYSTYLEHQKLVIFGLHLCSINHKNYRSWNHKTHSFWEKVWHHIPWNSIIIFNGDTKCVLLIRFLLQNLITLDNPISMWLRWIWNSAFWREVENLRQLETIVSYKPLPILSQGNRKTLPSALLDISTT